MPSQAMADRADTGNSSRNAPPVSAGQVDLTKPAQVITNYQQTGSSPTPSKVAPQAQPQASQGESKPGIANKRSSRTKRKRKSSGASRTSHQRASQSWFDSEGTQLVETVRDCVTGFAASVEGPRTSYALRQIISSAIDTECREPFDQMAEQVADKLGEDRFREISQQLVSDLLASSLQQDQPVNHAATDG